jgi:Chaperone of endosialidase
MTILDTKNWVCRTQESIVCFGGGNNTSTTKSDPWEGQQPYIKDVMSKAQGQYNNFTPQFYGGSTVAGLNPIQNQAIGATAATGLYGSPVLNAAQNSTKSILDNNPNNNNPSNGGFWSQMTGQGLGQKALQSYANGDQLSAGNPYFQQMAQTTLGQVVPGLEQQFAQGNAMNSPAAAYAVSKGANDAIGQLAYQNYGQQQQNQIGAAEALSGQQLSGAQGLSGNYNSGVGNQISAANQAQGLYQTQLGGQQAAMSAGQTQQDQAQKQIQDQIDRWNFAQQQPYSKLNQYSNLVGGQYGGTTTASTPKTSPFDSLFSDRRLKDNIKKIGMADNGLNIYSFNYKWDIKTVIGYMADEVKKICPQAVHEGPFGYEMVNYGMVR